MAIVKMKKLTLAAPRNDRDSIIDLLQTKGSVQLINMRDAIEDYRGLDISAGSKSVTQTEIEYNHVKFAYEFLKRFSNDKRGMLSKKEVMGKDVFDNLHQSINWKNIYDTCKELDEAIVRIKNRETRLTTQIETYSDWVNLDVSGSELDGLKKVLYFIGTLARKYESELYDELSKSISDIYIEKVSEKKQDINVIILCHADDSLDVSDILKKYGFVKASLDLDLTPAAKVSQYNEELSKLHDELHELNSKSAKLAENIRDIEKVLDYYSNNLNRENAVSNLAGTQKTFILQGWIPETHIRKTTAAIEKNFTDVYMEFEEPQDDESPPVVLKNNWFAEPFEAITSMYALPRPKEVDPTPVLAPFYLFFFGMMAGDIGYGILLLLGTLFALKYMDLEGNSRKVVKLLLYCSIPTIFFGWVFGGFFGDAIKIKPLWINPVDNPMDVLYVSMALGLLHLYTGLGVKAYWLIKNGKILDAIFDVFFWYLLISGLIWMLMGGSSIATYMAIAGAAGLLLTQGRSNETIIGKLFGGIYGLYGVTSYIGDILSYSRLLALGLATGLIGSSFNLLIKLLGGGVAAIIAGPLIFVAGHTFNLLIGMLGTFVHTCRLEYLEFFGKFYEGGGKPFEPLSIKTKFVKVNVEE